MKIATNIYAVASLLIANVIPLIGVWYFGWNIASIMLLYWTESAIIGFFAIKKMRFLDAQGIKTAVTANKTDSARPEFSFSSVTINGKTFNSNQEIHQAALGSLFFIPFFIIHYGIFMFVHLIFLLVFFFSFSLDWGGMLIGFLGLCFSHYVSFKTNFINGKEYLRTNVPAEMFKPYPRIIVMHLTIILGAFFILESGAPVGALVLLVVLKIIVDLGSHFFTHLTPQKLVMEGNTVSISSSPPSGGKKWWGFSSSIKIKQK